MAHSAATSTWCSSDGDSTISRNGGKLYKVKVIAFDPGGEIGWARLWRAVVFKERVEHNASLRQLQHVNLDKKKSPPKYEWVELQS